MDAVATDSSAAEENENSKEWCLKRVGGNSEWLFLVENTEITVGRGLNVTYQLLSPINPLMISRLHCVFRQREDGIWTVTDRKSLNGVWVNGKRIPAETPHHLQTGDSLQLGVPINNTIDYEYILCCLPKKDIMPYLAKVCSDTAPSILKRTKRKFNNSIDETEPSTSSKTKHYRRSNQDNSSNQSCPVAEDQARARTKQPEVSCSSTRVHEVDVRSEGTSDLDDLQRFSQNILMLREQVDDTQKHVASLKGEPQHVDPVREEEFRVLQKTLQTLKTKMRKMETMEKSFSEIKAEKTQQEEDVLKKQLDDALQEQKKVMEELALSRQGFEKVLQAKDKDLQAKDHELQLTKETAQAQKEEVVAQVTEVLENELQCIICSELFVEAVNLNCAHSFCMHCIREWRKKKNECPICRREIQSQTRCLALDNCIERMVENLSHEMKERRQTLVAERKSAEPLVIKDEDSTPSNSISSLDDDSDRESVLSLDSNSNSVISVDSEDRRFLGWSDEDDDDDEDED